MKTRTIVILALVLAGVAYAVGRYLQPAKVITKTEVKTEVVEVEVEKTKTEYRTIVKEIIKPDGTKVKETITENIEESKKKNTTEAKQESKTEKIVENLKPQWKVQVMADFTQIDEPANYRVGIERRIIGPIHAGAWSETNFNSFGLSVSMEF